MDNKEDAKQPKPNRLKFSRLCLSQNRNAGVAVRSNSQLPSSQISRFFSYASEDTQKVESATKYNENDDDETVKCSKNTTNSCDNELVKRSNIEPGKSIKTQSDEKKKIVQRADKMTDTKSTIKSFFTNENNDSLSDFEIPSKVAKKVPKALPSKTSKSSRSRRKQPDIRKALTKKSDAPDDYSHFPEDAQLELALALSKAESALHQTNSDASTQPLDLEQFEFKPTNAKSNTDFLDFFNTKRKAKTRFKWNSKCTQLTRRNDDVQKTKARDKIDEILLNNIIVESNQSKRSESPTLFHLPDYTPYEIHSRCLQRICVTERILFEMNNREDDTGANSCLYYTNNLVEPSEHKVGVLLKDWSRIPGRDSIYDGIQKTDNEFVKTDTSVIPSSPEYDTQTESEDTDNLEGQALENYVIAENNGTEQQMEEAGCSNVMQQRPTSPIDVQIENEIDGSNDGDATLMMDSDDIQLKVDAINSKIRLSQNCSDILQPPVFTYEVATATRALSPDLFDDEDDIDMTEEIQDNNYEHSPLNQHESTVTQHDEDTVEASSSDVVVISSSECNSNSNSVISKNVLDKQIQDELPNMNEDIEVIELLDSDSENMLKDCVNSPRVHVLDSEERDVNTPQLVYYNVWDDDYENIMDNFGNLDNLEQPAECVPEAKNHSVEPNDVPTLVKKLSFTERLELFEKDMLNGFTADIPEEYLNQSQMQRSHASQESIDLSDDEINYSMRKNVVHANDDEHFNMMQDENDHYHLPSSPIEFNHPELSFPECNFNHETEEKLVNQSVCNIFEKTFDQTTSPITAVTKKRTVGAKSLKKVNSETVLNSRYGNPVPSTSSTNVKRVLLTPDKNNRMNKIDAPKNLSNSPFSQPTAETRMDLSNEDYFIQIGSISPKPNYEEMDTITLEIELRKYGLKPSLRRRQAIICLEYIYNRTHPFMESINELQELPKVNQINELEDIANGNDRECHIEVEDTNELKDPQIDFNIGFATHNLVDEKFKKRAVDKVFLPSVPRAKKPWCLVPLHIAWHNLIKANPDLRKVVLMYEPINLVELKKYFKTIDMTFDNRDLISFLDLHCITFRMPRATKD